MSFFAAKKINTLYENGIKRYDTSVDFKVTSNSKKKKFIGKGYGASSLNTYRKVILKDKIYFKKIYFKDNDDYKKAILFSNYLRDHIIGDKIVVPELYTFEEGEKLVILYYEYIPIPKIKNDRRWNFKRSLEITKTIENVEVPNKLKGDELFRNFSKDKMFKERFDKILDILKSNQGNLKIFHRAYSLIINGRRCLQHGDLFSDNFTETVVIDWDRVGYYPYGFDIGLILSFHKLKYKQKMIKPKTILKNINKLGIKDKNDILSTYFFTVIFLYNRDEPTLNCDFHKLTAHLQKLL